MQLDLIHHRFPLFAVHRSDTLSLNVVKKASRTEGKCYGLPARRRYVAVSHFIPPLLDLSALLCPVPGPKNLTLVSYIN